MVRAEFGEDRQAEDLGAEALSDGQRAGRIVEVGVGRLAVDRNWVVDDRCDAGVLKLLFQPVAAAGFREAKVGAVSGWCAGGTAGGRGATGGDAHDELVPAVARGTGLGQDEAVSA